MTTKEKIARIQTVVAEMNSIPVFLDGTLKKNRKKIKHKDGSFSYSREQYMFQSKGGRKNRTWKRIPAEYVDAVMKLVENGMRYNELSEEYKRLVSEVSFDDLKKGGNQSSYHSANSKRLNHSSGT